MRSDFSINNRHIFPNDRGMHRRFRCVQIFLQITYAGTVSYSLNNMKVVLSTNTTS